MCKGSAVKNKGIIPRKLEEVIEWWPFILSGLDALNDTSGARANMSANDLFRVAVSTALGDPDRGLVLILASKNDKPLSYIIATENTDLYGPRTLVAWAAYTNRKCATALKDNLDILEKWARHAGFEELQAQSRRMNGSAMRLFERRWGFTRHCITFKKAL